MTDPGWAVVLFEGEEETVEAVPHNWLCDIVLDDCEGKVGFCYWPPKNTKNVTDLVKRKDDFVEGVWNSHPVTVLGEYDSYELARYKSIKAVDRSDLNTSDANSKAEKKRKTFTKHIFSPFTIKPKRGRQPASRSKESDDSELDLSNEEDLPPALPSTPLPANQSKKDESFRAKRCLTYEGNKQDRLTSPRKKKCLSSPRKRLTIPFPEFVAFKRETTRSLAEISMQLTVLSENVANALRSRNDLFNSDDVMDEEFNALLSSLPLKTYEEVLNAEKSLDLKIVYEALVNHLSSIGGITPKEATKRMLKTLLTDDSAQKFSFYGLKNKSPFCKLKIKDALFKSVKRNFKDCTDAEMEAVVKDWLRQAKSRSDLRNKTPRVAEKVSV